MRLWSLDPKYLDPQGLVALWREGLLAQKVLQGGTKGYRNHPQLVRFRATLEPVKSIGYYLMGVYLEAEQRGYSYDQSKIATSHEVAKIPVTTGQLNYELAHLRQKLMLRSPNYIGQLPNSDPEPHPSFTVQVGTISSWEKIIKLP